jgi:hypothetical protein
VSLYASQPTKETTNSEDDHETDSPTLVESISTDSTIFTQESLAEPGAYYVTAAPQASSTNIPGDLLTREANVLQQLGLYSSSPLSVSSPQRASNEAATEPYLTQAMLVEDDEERADMNPALVVEAKPLRSNRKATYCIILAVFLGFALAGGLVAGLRSQKEGARSPSSSSTPSPTDSPTRPPTLAPTSQLEAELRSMLPEKTLLALEDTDSPQSRAYDWFTEVDEVFRLATAIVETDETFREDQMKQRYALATVYFATGGPKWSNQVLWLNASAHECSWYGCYCTEGLNGSLLGLDLSQNGLQGNVPPEVGMLGTSLQHVGLGANSLIGNFQQSLGNSKD